MFGILSNLTKAVVNVVTLPIDIVADDVTLGGVMADRDKPYTVEKVQRIFDNVTQAGK